LVLEIPGDPKTKENSYKTTKKTKKIFVPKDLVDWEENVHTIATETMKLAGWPGPWAGRVTVAADIRFNSWHERDIPNFWKSLLDGLSGAVYDDDSQIDRTMQCRQKSSENPGITVYIWFHDFDFNDFGKKRPREWNELTCADIFFPDVFDVVASPDDVNNVTRFAQYGAGRKVEERERAALKKMAAKADGKKKPRKIKSDTHTKGSVKNAKSRKPGKTTGALAQGGKKRGR
jgi:Holliday junction resolvase RusA-like endonuclease